MLLYAEKLNKLVSLRTNHVMSLNNMIYRVKTGSHYTLKIVSEYDPEIPHNNKLQTNQWHREEACPHGDCCSFLESDICIANCLIFVAFLGNSNCSVWQCLCSTGLSSLFCFANLYLFFKFKPELLPLERRACVAYQTSK